MTRRPTVPVYDSIASNDYFTSTLPSSRRTAFVDLCQFGVHHRHPNLSHNARRRFRADPAVELFGTDTLAEACRRPLLSTLHTMGTVEAPASSLLSSSTMLLSRVVPAVLGTISYVVTSLTSLLLPVASHLQRTGETLLATLLLLSVVQATVALYQYRYDARGQLAFPDGPTLGTEDYYAECESLPSVGMESDSDDGRAGERREADVVLSNAMSDVTGESHAAATVNSSWATRLVRRLNESLVLLLPWITQSVHNLLTKNTHLFHVGFIVFILDSILPFMTDGGSEVTAHDGVERWPPLLQKIVYHSEPLSADKDPIRLLVIGDSLSIGIGCVERFDATKDNSVPMALVENTSRPPPKADPRQQGPVFPRALARTLSYHFRRPVRWRSAGVDGGDVDDIRSYCTDVVGRERSGDAVDIVVVLFGMNDLKKLLSSNPVRRLFSGGGKDDEDGGTNGYRRGMESLLSDIRARAPDALVVFPAMPVQPFNKNSIINIFPLGLMVDAVLGVWERQKKIVAESEGSNALFLELKTREIADWYSSTDNNMNNDINDNSSIKNNRNSLGDIAGERDFNAIKDFDDVGDDVLLSPDGVHPNKRMYAKWAELVGHKLYERIITQMDLTEPNRDWLSSESEGRLSKGKRPERSGASNKLKA